MTVNRLLWGIAIALYAFHLSGCAGNAVISGLYNQNDIFLKSRTYSHDFSSTEDEVKIYMQTRPDKKGGRFTQMLTLTHVNGEQLISGLALWNPEHTRYYRAILPDRRCGSKTGEEREECNAAVTRYLDNVSQYMEQQVKNDRPHRLRGQQSVRMKAGMHNLTLLLYGHSSMGRGDIGIYEVPNIFFYPASYLIRFTVDGIFVNQRKIHIWIENEETKEMLWEMRTKD